MIQLSWDQRSQKTLVTPTGRKHTERRSTCLSEMGLQIQANKFLNSVAGVTLNTCDDRLSEKKTRFSGSSEMSKEDNTDVEFTSKNSVDRIPMSEEGSSDAEVGEGSEQGELTPSEETGRRSEREECTTGYPTSEYERITKEGELESGSGVISRALILRHEIRMQLMPGGGRLRFGLEGGLLGLSPCSSPSPTCHLSPIFSFGANDESEE